MRINLLTKRLKENIEFQKITYVQYIIQKIYYKVFIIF